MKKAFGLLLTIMALMSCEKDQLELQTETVDFYNWNMQEVKEMIIYNPIEPERIESYNVVIYSDYDIFPIEVTNFTDGGSVELRNDLIIMSVDEGAIFDTKDFDSTEQYRGHVIIKYY